MKKTIILSLIILLTLSNCKQELEFTDFKIPQTSIRAIKVIDDNLLWFAGEKGKYGRIIDNKLEIDSIYYNDKPVNFRSIAYNGKNIFILSIESPALLYKIDLNMEKEPEIVYIEEGSKVFYDAISFFDMNRGIAIGDPTSSCASVITTNDAGNTWNKIDCQNIPEAHEGEASFAASNSNIAVFDSNVWFITGGVKSRIFKSENYGETWKVTDLPIVQGSQMTGAFTLDFHDKKTGIVMGGNWEDKKSTERTKATTTDSGDTWTSTEGTPGYISCVKYIPNSRGKKLIATSTEGIYTSNDAGYSWRKISDKGYFSISVENGDTFWLSVGNTISKLKV